MPKSITFFSRGKTPIYVNYVIAHNNVRVPTVHKKHCHKDSAFLVNQADRPLGGPYEPLATNH